MKKIAVIGHFGGEKELFDGQTIKTKILWEELEKTNNFEMQKTDTFEWRKNPLKLLNNCKQTVRRNETVLMLPDYNGFRTLSVLLPVFNKNHQAKLVYVVVGGWLPEYLNKHPFYLSRAEKFNAIVVETASIKTSLEKLGLNNIFVVPNFKRLDFAKQASSGFEKPYSFCFFSRVIPEKGIEQAIQAVQSINQKLGTTKCILDIYGPIGEDFKDSFKKLLNGSETCIHYKGIVPFTKSVDALQKYYALLFPTCYYAECLPGTIIDAYASAVPVIAFNWSSGPDVVKHKITGWLCEENTVESLVRTMEDAMADEEIIKQMKQNCLTEAEKYSPAVCVPEIMRII